MIKNTIIKFPYLRMTVPQALSYTGYEQDSTFALHSYNVNVRSERKWLIT